jgi:hypothetical protein
MLMILNGDSISECNQVSAQRTRQPPVEALPITVTKLEHSTISISLVNGSALAGDVFTKHYFP